MTISYISRHLLPFLFIIFGETILTMKNSLLPKGGLLHTYQRTLDEGVFLYRIQERLMLYTILSVKSRNHDVRVAAVAFMFNHIHTLQEARTKTIAHGYLGDVMSVFVKELNSDCGRVGPMFSPVDSAYKYDGKKCKEATAYLYNNSVEKKLFRQAIEDRWNFLAYCQNSHPFSEKLVIRRSSRMMRKAIVMVNDFHRRSQYLNLAALRRIFSGLDKKETEQLIDYIIVKYAFIDYSLTIRYYKDFDNMLMAIDSNTGSEFEIKEGFERISDKPIREMCIMAKRLGLLGKDMRIYSLSKEEKQRLAQDFMGYTGASGRHVAKFFHITSGV